MKKIGFIVLALVFVGGSCSKKKKTPASTEKLFTFNSVTADHDTILKGNVTNIKANFTGSGTCKWAASAGDIFGNGNVVLFGASTCCTGNHDITCTVTDANGNSEQKTKSVFVQ